MNSAVDVVVAKWYLLKERVIETDEKLVVYISTTKIPDIVDFHTAALVVALERLLIPIEERGIWP